MISLERTPERLSAFRQRLGALSMHVSWQPGFDGQGLDLIQLKAEGVLSESAMCWPLGQIGCALSHLEAWRHCQSSQKPLLVFEDDVMLSRNWPDRFQQILQGFPLQWDLVLLGWNQDSCLQWEWSPGFSATALFRPRSPTREQLQAALDLSQPSQLFPLHTALGLAGYVVSPKGASKLLKWALPLRTLPIETPELPKRDCFSLDGQLNSFYKSFGAYICMPPLAVGMNEATTSLTQH